jgi:hypothetical protein
MKLIMKSIIFTFLTICLLSFSAFGQTEMTDKEAIKVDETGVGFGCDWNTRLARLRDEGTFNSKASIGLLIYKGITDKPQVYLQQLKSINREVDFVGLDRAKIKIIDGGFRETYTVEFWIVPEGAENPKPPTYAEKVNEFGNAMSGDLKFGLFSLTEKLDSHVLYICNFGSKKNKLKRVKVISSLIKFLSFEKFGIQLIDGGTSKTLKTEFWLMPKIK